MIWVDDCVLKHEVWRVFILCKFPKATGTKEVKEWDLLVTTNNSHSLFIITFWIREVSTIPY